ncbi:hypothetical protein [Methylobacterium sp. XJLW]|uniref:hypothetical protein n=1 Tax=Methylobacterium sp. XJLW TaxID=739141 RepID=UPI000F54F137|nr:hypothetical protein [Methylobacterium sp. XJLW]
MSSFSDDLLTTSKRLIRRKTGQRGPLKAAYVRRSISTTYYALFHFCLDETALRLVGSTNDLKQRRRVFIRTFSHTGLTTAFGKLKGAHIDKSVENLFLGPGNTSSPIATPAFVQQLATAYLDAIAKREDADYNLNEPLSATDASQLHRRVKRAIDGWKQATTPADRDFKHAVSLLLSLKDQIRREKQLLKQAYLGTNILNDRNWRNLSRPYGSASVVSPGPLVPSVR